MYLQPTLLKGYVVVLDREKAQYGRIIDFIFNFVKAEYIKAVPFCSQKTVGKNDKDTFAFMPMCPRFFAM